MKRCTGALVCAIALGLPAAAAAQPKTTPAPATEALTEDQAKAQRHFQRAKELYQAGSYREAVGELEAARALDPKAKDLVYNLGIVHEKLGKFDEAIGYFRSYLDLESVTPAEKQKAESIIKRIEGAKREVPPGTPGDNGSGTTQPEGGGRVTQPPRQQTEQPAHGRVDAATITAASVAVIGLGVGATFGVLAMSTRPKDFVTGRDGTYEDLQKKTGDAHTMAIVADVGFGAGVVSAALAAYLYFGRTKEPRKTAAAATVLPGGAAIVVGGSFR